MKSKRSYLNAGLRTAVIVILSVILIMATVLFYKGNNTTAQAASTDVTNTANYSTDTIYQIVTDRFFDGDPSNNPTGAIFDKNNPQKYHGGDWAGVTQKMNAGYFTNMGISAIWISAPIENINSIDPSNNCAAYHGYWGKDFFKTNQYFGSINDFQTLVNTAHAKNIKVVIDFAPNHTSTAEFGTMQFPEDGKLYKDGSLVGGFTNDNQGLFNHEGWTDFSTLENSIYHSMYGLADLNHQNNTVDTYMKDAINKWLDLGVDGIRVDAVKHMPMGWQKNWLSSVYSKKPVFVFGEWFTGGTGSDPQMESFANESGMSVLDFRFANAVRGAVGDLSITMQQLHNVISATANDFKEVNDQVTFIDNHDMSRFATLSNNSARSLENAYVLLMTSRGVPTIYYGSEQYATGGVDPYNRGDMPSFNQSSKAYQVISKLAPLRKSNPALSYGNTTERWINNDVYVYERKFGDSVVLTAVNRNQSASYNITGCLTSLPNGTYYDSLQNLLGGGNITVTNGAIGAYTLGAGQSAVWQYKASSEATPIIGNVDPMMGKAGNIVTVTGSGFGASAGNVKFGTVNATIKSWTDSCITLTVPTVAAGTYGIKVTKSTGAVSNVYEGFNVLTGTQVSVRFKVNNATTAYGENVYLVGSAAELGAWDVTKAIGPMFNATASIATYPTWFYDISVPANTRLEYKFVKINANGVVVWESGSNHVYTTGTTTGEAVVSWS